MRQLKLLFGLCCAVLLLLAVPAYAQEGPLEYQTTRDGAWVSTSSLLEAVDNSYEGGTIRVLSDVEISTPLMVTKTLHLEGVDTVTPPQIVNKTAGHAYLFTIQSGTLSFTNLTLDGGSAQGVQATRALIGVMAPGAALELNNTTLQNNTNVTKRGLGGGICLVSGTATLTNSTITNCAAYSGGAVGTAQGMASNLVIENSRLTNNKSLAQNDFTNGGGALLIARGAHARLSNTTLSGNTAGCGGAIFVLDYNPSAPPADGSLTMENCTLTSNSANYGGALYTSIYTSTLYPITLHSSTVTANHAEKQGGGLYVGNNSELHLGGKVVVSDNTNNAAKISKNLYMVGTWEITPPKGKVLVDSSLEGTKIGLSTTLDFIGQPNSYLGIVEGTDSFAISANDQALFFSDDPAYHVTWSSPTIGLQPHTYAEAFSVDDENHWHECTVCGEIEPGSLHAHTWGEPVVTKEVDPNDNSVTLRTTTLTCVDCGYRKETVERIESDPKPKTDPETDPETDPATPTTTPTAPTTGSAAPAVSPAGTGRAVPRTSDAFAAAQPALAVALIAGAACLVAALVARHKTADKRT